MNDLSTNEEFADTSAEFTDPNIDAMFDEDLQNISTSAPILRPGVYTLALHEVEVKENAKGTGKNLNLVFVTVDPAFTLDDKELKPGYKVFHTVSLVPTDKYDPKQNLAKLKLSLTGNKAGAFGDPSQYIGLTCNVQMAVQPAKDEYEARGIIKQFYKPGKSPLAAGSHTGDF